jgi:hypothetical protein
MRIRAKNLRIRIQGSKKSTDPADPDQASDPENWYTVNIGQVTKVGVCHAIVSKINQPKYEQMK